VKQESTEEHKQKDAMHSQHMQCEPWVAKAKRGKAEVKGEAVRSSEAFYSSSKSTKHEFG
jgi:hypothetical protein